jgi:ribosomal protein S18 acetylase RimI-like enzyme
MISERILTNLIEYYSAFESIEGADFFETENLFVFKVNKRSCLNFVFPKLSSYKNIQACIHEYIEMNGKFDYSLRLFLTEEEILEHKETIRKLGLFPVKAWTNMHMTVSEKIKPTHIDNFQIVKLSNEAALKDWVDIYLETEENTGLHFDDFNLIFNNPQFALYTGYYEGLPVATSMSLADQNYLGLYLIAVKKEFRKKGLGREITLYPMLESYQKNIKDCVLHATKAGARLYEKIGFEKYGKMYIFAQNKT